MADRVPARLTPAEGRKFGLTVGAAFLVMGGLSFWRGHDTAPLVLSALGGVLFAAGAVIPRLLGPVYRAWMAFALALSKVTTPLFMGLLYFVVITPMGVVMRVFGRNPIAHRPREGTYWVRRKAPADPADAMRHQF